MYFKCFINVFLVFVSLFIDNYVNDIVLIIILINKWYGYLNYNKFILIIKFMIKCKNFM